MPANEIFKEGDLDLNEAIHVSDFVRRRFRSMWPLAFTRVRTLAKLPCASFAATGLAGGLPESLAGRGFGVFHAQGERNNCATSVYKSVHFCGRRWTSTLGTFPQVMPT